ncbi:MAG: hypothetical protein HGA85_07800, partial [Nanoarchaeota archaeon]|nr:hypothetical protein [Nanoarchaeota archaeon]
IKDRSNIRFALLAFIILVMFSLLNPYILQDASHKRLYFTNTIKEILLPGSLDMSLAEIIYLLEPILPLGLLLLLAPEGIVSLVIYLAGTAILLIHINQGTLIVLHTNITHAVSSISAPFLIFGVFCIKQLESLRLPKRAIKIALFAVFAFALFFGSRYFIMQHNNLSYGQIIESWGALGHVPENASLALDYFMIAQGSSRSNALCYNELPREDSLENIDFILLNSAHPYLNNLSLEGSNVILERFRPVTAGHYILLERKETIS